MPYVILKCSVVNLKLTRTEGLRDDIFYQNVYGSFGIKEDMDICSVLNILDKENFQIVSQSQDKYSIIYTLYSEIPLQAKKVSPGCNPVLGQPIVSNDGMKYNYKGNYGY